MVENTSYTGKRDSDFRQCSKTVMDNIADPLIVFDKDGICNYYYMYAALESTQVFKEKAGAQKLEDLIREIKASRGSKKYDCITGVSGGVDSSYLALQAKKQGLNPLIVHFDNGWNSELAVNNIQNIISRLGFDLHTLVVDWEEFKDLQRAYFKANVVDIEALTDHAIIATLYKLASQHGIKYILSGNNIVTEGILPTYWIFNKTDALNINDIHDKFGSRPLKTYPLFSPYMKKYYMNVKGIKTIPLLNYMQYNKHDVKQIISAELGWRDYGGKHSESIFTRFYQGYILPVKFKIDKRKAHLSTLICSGQITKDEAIEELKLPIYDSEQLKIDKEFVMKKLGFTAKEFDEYLGAPRREHTEFRHEKGMWDDIPFIKPLQPIWQLTKKIMK